MKNATLVALKAILESDPPRSQSEREQIAQTFGVYESAEKGVADRIIPISEAARRLNRTPRSLHNLAARGVIKKAKLPGMVRACGVRESDLSHLLAVIA